MFTFMTMTAAQVLAYLVAACPSKVETVPEENKTVVYKCENNPFRMKPTFPKRKDKDQSRITPAPTVPPLSMGE